MMAFDRTPPPAALDPQTVQALARVLARSVGRGNHADELRGLLRRAAEESRLKGIRAEQLLMMLKDIWYSLPEVAGAQSSASENALLRDLITRCIQEYYAL
jgi:hypothetical protein